MRNAFRRLMTVATICIMCMGLSGCFFYNVIATMQKLAANGYTIQVNSKVKHDPCTTSSSTASPGGTDINCTASTADGVSASSGMSTDNPNCQNQEKDCEYLDPLVIQIYAGATNISGTYDDGNGTSGPLAITAGLTSIPVDATTNLVAETGQQIVIVDLPPGVPRDATYTYTFQMTSTSVLVRPILTGKVVVAGKAYYPPIFPCVTSFKDAPNFEFDPSKPVELLTAAFVAKVQGCNHKVYHFGGSSAATANYQGLWWVPNGAENFWGINFVHNGDQVYATWYTYDTSGNPWWLSMLAMRTSSTSNAYTGDIYVDSGPAFNAYTGKGVPTKVGSGTLTFTDANNGTFSYSVNAGGGVAAQTKTLTRYVLDASTAQPSCSYSATTPAFAAAGNYQDLWWVPNAAEDGWGINFAHQGNLLFATWYTYGANGAPLWLSALAQRSGTSNKFSGNLFRTSGPRYDAYDTTKAVPQSVGTATFTFNDGNNATFNYTTNGTGGLPAVNQSKQITRFAFAPSGGTLCH